MRGPLVAQDTQRSAPLGGDGTGSAGRHPGLAASAGRERVIRPATEADAAVLYRLITANLEAGRLLPRSLPELLRHAPRFFVAVGDGAIIGCAELAPLSQRVAEIRSLVVDEAWRGNGVGRDLILTIRRRARADGFATLCAFTHDARPFVRLGFSIVPHVWVPEKIATDCRTCPLFRRCGQVAVVVRP